MLRRYLKVICLHFMVTEVISCYSEVKFNEGNYTRLQKCDVHEHVPGETYVEITNFLHGYISNKKNIHPRGQCFGECEEFKNTETYKCGKNRWCRNQPSCAKVVKCRFLSARIDVCVANMSSTHRRYHYVKDKQDGQVLGTETHCNSRNLFHLATQMRGLYELCHYCFCLCDEGPTPSSDIFISLRTAMANISDHRVVTGLRFVKRNRIVHFQIQEGQLLPERRIDRETIRWVPVDDLRVEINDKGVHESEDYHTLSWEKRSVHLNDVMADQGFLITGVRFRKFGSRSRLHLEVLTTPFDRKSGRLVNPELDSTYKSHPERYFINKFGKELKLPYPDVPTRAEPPLSKHTVDRFVRFTHTDYYKDAAQSTVPFFDGQHVEATRPLIGIGIFHKGKDGSGGFIAPRIFTL